MAKPGAVTRALDGEDRRNWLAFAAIAAINCWTSYFALTLVLPALAVVTAIKLAGSWRRPFPRDGWRTLRAPALAFGAVPTLMRKLPLHLSLAMHATLFVLYGIVVWRLILRDEDRVAVARFVRSRTHPRTA
jgi:hypothetical protein